MVEILERIHRVTHNAVRAHRRFRADFEREKVGEKQNELNCEFGENAALVCDYVILVGRKQTESIHQGLLNKGYPEDKIYIAASFNEAINHAYALNSHGEKKVILLENDLPDNY